MHIVNAQSAHYKQANIDGNICATLSIIAPTKLIIPFANSHLHYPNSQHEIRFFQTKTKQKKNTNLLLVASKMKLQLISLVLEMDFKTQLCKSWSVFHTGPENRVELSYRHPSSFPEQEELVTRRNETRAPPEPLYSITGRLLFPHISMQLRKTL